MKADAKLGEGLSLHQIILTRLSSSRFSNEQIAEVMTLYEVGREGIYGLTAQGSTRSEVYVDNIESCLNGISDGTLAKFASQSPLATGIGNVAAHEFGNQIGLARVSVEGPLLYDRPYPTVMHPLMPGTLFSEEPTLWP